jgi:acetyltransferase-like isoleucine patch superfamily enzyme
MSDDSGLNDTSDNELGGTRHDLGNGSVAWAPCHVGKGAVIGADCSVGALAHVGSEAVLGDRVRVQGGAYVASICILENDVFIGPNATLLNDRHPPSQDWNKWLPVTVRAGAVIGGGATVLPGVTIGERAVVAAGAVATKDIPAAEVWGGIPARFIMSRDEYEANRVEGAE